MKPAQQTPPYFSTPLLLLALLLFVTCVVIGLSSCNPVQDRQDIQQTDTVMESQSPAIPPPIDSMGADSMNDYPLGQQ